MSLVMRGKWPVAAAFVVIAGAMLAGFIQFRKWSAGQPAKAASAEAAKPALREVSLQGRIMARDLVKVPVPVDGRLTAVHVEPGSDVYEGQLLAEIQNEGLASAQQAAVVELERAQERVYGLESSIAAARLEASRASADAGRARSEFDRASRNYARQSMLLSEGATPRQVADRAEKEFLALRDESKNLTEVASGAEARAAALQSDLDTARKLLEAKGLDAEAAKERVEAGQVLSPATGVVAARRAAVGDEVHPAMDDLFQIATNLSNLNVVLEPGLSEMAKIHPGQAALITVADLQNGALEGAVKSVEGGKVTVEFASPDPVVRPGLTAFVRIRW